MEIPNQASQINNNISSESPQQIKSGESNNSPQAQTEDSSTLLNEKLNSQNISDILARLNLAPNETNQKIVENLIKYQLPLEAELITELQDLIAQEEEDSLLLKSIIFLKKANLEINETSIKLLSDFFSQEQSLASDLMELINNSPSEIKDILENFILKPEQDSNNFSAKQLKSTILNLGLDLERNILMDHQINNNSNLKALLMNLKNSNQQLPMENIDNLINNLTKQKLIMHNKGNKDNAFLYLQLPIQFTHSELNTAHLVIYHRDARNSKTKSKNKSFNIFLKLETENLGLMNIELNFYNQNLNLKIKADSQKTLDLIQSKVESLKFKIEDLEFQIQELEYSILEKNKQDLELENRLLEPNPLDLDSILHQIDIKI